MCTVLLLEAAPTSVLVSLVGGLEPDVVEKNTSITFKIDPTFIGPAESNFFHIFLGSLSFSSSLSFALQSKTVPFSGSL